VIPGPNRSVPYGFELLPSFFSFPILCLSFIPSKRFCLLFFRLTAPSDPSLGRPVNMDRFFGRGLFKNRAFMSFVSYFVVTSLGHRTCPQSCSRGFLLAPSPGLFGIPAINPFSSARDGCQPLSRHVARPSQHPFPVSPSASDQVFFFNPKKFATGAHPDAPFPISFFLVACHFS